MNQVLLVGRLCHEPIVFDLEQERKKSYITLAVNRSYKNADGFYEVDFINCILWNDVAKNTFSYCHTGDVIGVRGRLQTRCVEENNEKKYLLEVVAERITFLSSCGKNKDVEE